MSSRRNPGVAFAAGMLALALAAPSARAAPAASAPAPVLSALSPDAPVPTAAGVARALTDPLADPALGVNPHVEVIDAVTGRVLLDRRGRVPAIPASTHKLLTAAAALLVLGPRTRLTTRVLVAGPDVYLAGGGDPTLATQTSVVRYPASSDLIQLARTVARSHRAVRRVIAVGSQYSGPDDAPGWLPSYLAAGQVARVRSLLVDEGKLTPGLLQTARVPDPVLAAAQSFKAALTFAGVQTGPASVGAAPHPARIVATSSSAPVAALVERMLNYSDADIAEGLGRQVAMRSGLPATFAGTAAALKRVTRALGLPASTRIADASGLSRDDALAPATLTGLLRQAAFGPYPQLRALIPALAVAGFSGTLAVRFTGDAASGAGRVRAKTGWLNGAAGLAGVVTTGNGRLLIFAALAPAPYRFAGEAALDRLAATLAACGCR